MPGCSSRVGLHTLLIWSVVATLLIIEILLFSDGDNFDEEYVMMDEKGRPVVPDPQSVSWCNFRAVPDFYHIVPLIRVRGKLFQREFNVDPVFLRKG
jgi:hypothetical protein